MKRLVLVLVLVPLLAFVSCKEPTQVIVEAYTDVSYRPGIVTSFTVGTPGQTEKAEPTTETAEPWSGSLIGTLVVVPGSTQDAALSVKLVMGVTRGARECVEPDYKGCIVARRRLRYVPNELLRLPITLYARCEDVPCDEFSTCSVLGQCVPAEVDPSTCGSPGGCKVPGDDGPPPTGVAPDAAPALDASPDASVDANAVSDAGEAGVADGGPTTPGYVECPGVAGGQCATAGSAFCCWSPVSSAGACSTDQAACYAASSSLIFCDDDSDCGGGETCCYNYGTPFLGCSANCNGLNVKVCHVDAACPAGKACSNKAFGHYSVCQ